MFTCCMFGLLMFKIRANGPDVCMIGHCEHFQSLNVKKKRVLLVVNGAIYGSIVLTS